MTNKKRKCTYCKEYSEVETGIKTPAGFFCDFDHAAKYANEKQLKSNQAIQKKKVKDFKKETARMKREYYAKDVPTRKEAAKTACHAYIRARDKDKPCPCCDEPLGDDFHAGHMFPDGLYSFTRYHEDNIHGQRLYCNSFRGGDCGKYKENAIKRIGLERYQYLDENKSKIVKRTAQDYAEIERYYKEKLKSLN